MSADPEQRRQLTTSDRSLAELAADLGAWLSTKLDGDAPPRIIDVRRPESGGMSSSSVLCDAEWVKAGITRRESFVVRMAPEDSSFPVFPSYDLARQYQIMTGVAAASDVPVPALHWLENDHRPLGSPFIVMKRVEGRIPADNPPYVFAGWLADATVADRARLAGHTIDIIAGVHGIADAASRFPALDGAGSALRRHVDAQRNFYHWALAADGFEIPLIERAFDWLDEHWPADPGTEVLNWGDARPGNIIYQDFTPVAVLDWEMAALGPREMDVAWLIFLHRFFQDIGAMFDHPGLPDFLRRDDVIARYEQRTGQTLRDMDFHLVYAALRHAVVMARIKRRMIHFDEDTVPADPDDYVMHRASLEAMLAGTCQWH